MELLRIFNRKRLLILALLFMINGVFFYRECSDTEMYGIYDELMAGVDTDSHQSDIEKAAKRVISEYMREHENIKENETFKAARTMFLEKAAYIKRYPQEKRDQIESSRAMLSGTLFSDRASFSYLNIQKTRGDLYKIKDAEVRLSNGIWLERVTEYKLIYYIMLIALVMVIYSFIEERKEGLIYIQYAAAGGRSKLFLKRLAILFAFTAVMAFLLFAEISIISLRTYKGAAGLTASVCSDEIFAMCSAGGISRIAWLALNAVRAALCMFAAGLFIWGLLTYFKNSNIGLLAFVLLFSAETVLNGVITDKSVFRIFKFFNLKYLIESRSAWFTYNNWGYRYFATDIAESTCFLAVLIGVISAALLIRNCILANPVGRIGFIEKMFMRAYAFFIKIFSSFPTAVMEFFKLFASQRIGPVVIIALILFADTNKGYVLKYDTVMRDVGTFCRSHADSTEEELMTVREELSAQKEYYESGESGEDARIAQYRAQLAADKIGRIDYVLKKRSLGINASLISQYEYEAAFGGNQEDNQEFTALLCILLMLMINAGAVSYEKKNGMMSRIIAAKNRNGWIIKKILYNGAAAMFLFLLFYGWYYRDLAEIYRLEDFNASVQSLVMFADYPLDIPVWGFVALDLVLKMLVMLALGGIAFMISGIFSYEAGYLISIMLLMPHFLYKLGAGIFSYVSLPRITAFLPFWNEGRCIYNISADMLIIAVGAACYIYTAVRLQRH